MHYTNNLLPKHERRILTEDENSFLSNIESNLSSLEVENGSPLPSLIAKTLKSVNIHLKLKYELPGPVQSRIISIFINTYIEKNVSFDQKVKILELLRNLVKRKHTKVDYELTQWRELWNESLTYILRDEKWKGHSCNNQMLIKLVGNIIGFLHDARRQIPRADMTTIVEEATVKLEHTAHIQSIEGLLMLLNLLPTDYDDYDSHLPAWVDVWKRISHNPMWDSCWLTLFCRARKHTRHYDWSQLAPIFHSKARELMSLPSIRGKVPVGQVYPLAFPHFFLKLVPSNIDPKKMGLNKLAKLMYSLTLTQSFSPVHADESILTPPKLGASEEMPQIPGLNTPGNIHPQALELVKFIQTMRPFLYPSNTGTWTPMLAYFLTTLVSEISRHMGRNLSNKLFDSDQIKVSHSRSILHGYRIFELPVHLDTIQFLCGLLTSIMMESLYGKNQMMSQFASGCLKNLCGIDPSLGRIIIPFLLDALDPQAVTQSHQAPLAMHALTDCLHPLLYPCPVILPYLPRLLKLSLPGIDANDQQKSCTALSMYVSLLGWVSVQKSYRAPKKSSWPPPFYSMVSSQMPLNSNYLDLYDKLLDQEMIQEHLDNLAIAFEEWAPSLLDRIFEVVEAQDEPKKGNKAAHIVGFVAECTALLFQSCSQYDDSSTSSMRAILENKVIEYYKHRLPVNAAKLSGKIVSCMTENNPKCLPRLLSALLDEDIVNATCSAEKISFRLRLLAGAVRFGRSENALNLPLYKMMLGSKFLFHSDKAVRKGSWKLLKDTLRGATSCYPINNTPLPVISAGEISSFEEKELLFGSPNSVSRHIEYFVPSGRDLALMAELIKDTAGSALKELRSEITELLDASVTGKVNSEKGGLSMKKTEERIHQQLKIITKTVRGAAEVLGDNLSNNEIENAALFSESLEDSEYKLNEYDVMPSDMLSRRSEVLKDLDQEFADLYLELRSEILQMLVRLGHILTSTSFLDGPLAQLQNNDSIVSAWLKLFTVTVKQRMASLKDTDNTKKWFSVTLRVHRTMVARTMRKGVKIRTLNRTHNLLANQSMELAPQWQSLLSTASYWLGNEYSSTSLCNRGWIQYALRLQQFSFISVEQITNAANPLQKVLRCSLYQLTRLCQHDYDAIRKKALQAFSQLHTRFGRVAIYSIQSMIKHIHESTTTSQDPTQIYARLSGLLLLFRQNLVARKMSRQWNLTETLINIINLCPQLITAVPDQDKREILSSLVADVFAKYVSEWSHVPFVKDRDSSEEMIRTSLSALGFTFEGKFMNSNHVDNESDGSEVRGLRSQAYKSFTIMHLIGHQDIDIDAGVWMWALHALCTAHGQPIQQVALAALTRLCSVSLGSSAATNGKALSNSVRDILTSYLSVREDNNNWNAFFCGLSHVRKVSGESTQWSRGIDSILRAAAVMRSTLPRKRYHLFYDRNVFSPHFSKENTHLIINIFSSELIPFNKGIVLSMIDAATKLPDESEEESRSSNATRAELFSALLRTAIESVLLKDGEAADIGQILCTTLHENVDKISLEFCKDWAEALAMAVADPKHQVVKSIREYLISEFSSLFTSDSTSTEGDDGFSNEGKKLTLVQALLVADIAYSVGNHAQSEISLVVANIMSKSGCYISAYRTSRSIISHIIGLFADAIHLDTFSPIIESILTACDHSSERTSRDALDILCSLSDVLLLRCRHLEYVYSILPTLLPSLLSGSGNANIETAKNCHDACLLVCQSVKVSLQKETSPCYKIIEKLRDGKNSSSWHVRETIMLSLAAFMANNWAALSLDDRKHCKDIFSEGILDPKPEIQQLARVGLVTYLSHKTPNELKGLSEAFCRNSDKYLLLEKRRKKENGDESAGTDKVDPKFTNTIMMMSCLVLCSPYDMPSYLPQLVYSLVRHKLTHSLKDTVSQTVLEFKRTHQDRWEEFKGSFSADQLDSLLNASHVSYCS
eukprot:GSChrysophyteH1.ASY1.ANO1.393.1 assembled CDS